MAAIETNLLLDGAQLYRRLIRRFLYLTMTRLNIAYFVQHLSQFVHDSKQSHLIATMGVIRYIKRNQGQGLFFHAKNKFDLSIQRDSDWASCVFTR